MMPLSYYLDGQTPNGVDVDVRLEGKQLHIRRANGEDIAVWSLNDLRHIETYTDANEMLLASIKGGEARLTLRDVGIIYELKKRAKKLNKPVEQTRNLKYVLGWVIGGVLALLLMIFVLVPMLSEKLAMTIPIEKEEILGKATIEQITKVLSFISDDEVKACENKDGLKALEKMKSRLIYDQNLEYDIKLTVLSVDETNAFAVPGGYVVLFDGLLQDANSPEEVAGVLGHEIGHVVHRDPTRIALRTAGTTGLLGLLMGDFFGGGAITMVGERLLVASYAQEAESQADQFAHKVLADAELPSAPFGDFFTRLSEDSDVFGDNKFLSHLASHPELKKRADRAVAANVVENDNYTPVLTDVEWEALQAICE